MLGESPVSICLGRALNPTPFRNTGARSRASCRIRRSSPTIDDLLLAGVALPIPQCRASRRSPPVGEASRGRKLLQIQAPQAGLLPFARDATVPVSHAVVAPCVVVVSSRRSAVEEPLRRSQPAARSRNSRKPLANRSECHTQGGRGVPTEQPPRRAPECRRASRREEVPAALPRLSHERGPGSTACGLNSARPRSAPGMTPHASPPPPPRIEPASPGLVSIRSVLVGWCVNPRGCFRALSESGAGGAGTQDWGANCGPRRRPKTGCCCCCCCCDLPERPPTLTG